MPITRVQKSLMRIAVSPSLQVPFNRSDDAETTLLCKFREDITIQNVPKGVTSLIKSQPVY